MEQYVAVFKCSLFIRAKVLVTRMCCIVYSCQTLAQLAIQYILHFFHITICHVYVDNLILVFNFFNSVSL